jgi:hypothetical protein
MVLMGVGLNIQFDQPQLANPTQRQKVSGAMSVGGFFANLPKSMYMAIVSTSGCQQ